MTASPTSAEDRIALSGGRPVDKHTPRKGQILAWCDHEADSFADGSSLTLYAAHADGMGYASTGFHIVEWGGAFEDSQDDGGAHLPDWWFVAGSEFEVAANPVLWWPLPGTHLSHPAAGDAALADVERLVREAVALGRSNPPGSDYRPARAEEKATLGAIDAIRAVITTLSAQLSATATPDISGDHYG